MISRAKECDKATTQETILPRTNDATWWHQTKITTTSGHTRDATACPLPHNTAESSRTPTRTTRTPIRMHTSHIAIAVHQAATAMTPDTGSEPTCVITRARIFPSFHPQRTLQQIQNSPKLYFFLLVHVDLLIGFVELVVLFFKSPTKLCSGFLFFNRAARANPCHLTTQGSRDSGCQH